MQEEFKKGKGVYIIVLKARQVGSTTMGAAVLLTRTATKSNVNSVIITHDSKTSSDVFSRVKFMHENLPPYFKPKLKASNAIELVFDDNVLSKNSKIGIYTAGNANATRGRTIH